MTIAMILKDRGPVATLGPDTSVAAAAALLSERGIGAVPVVIDGAVAGVFSERDVIHCLAKGGPESLSRPIGEAMTSPAVTVAASEPVIGALSLMTRRRIRHLPVVEGGRLVGFVSIGDLVKYRIERIEADAAAMREYIQSA